MSDKPSVDIKNWTLFGGVLYGQTFGHPRFDDGTAVRTSSIVDAPEEPKEGDIVETRNTLYRLVGKQQ